MLVELVVEGRKGAEDEGGIGLYAEEIVLVADGDENDIAVHEHHIAEDLFLLYGNEGCH